MLENPNEVRNVANGIAQMLLQLRCHRMAANKSTKLCDIVAQCAEDNAILCLCELFKTSKISKIGIGGITLNWISTHSVNGQQDHFELCGVCASSFIPRSRQLLELIL
jgi:hypothetical protein